MPNPIINKRVCLCNNKLFDPIGYFGTDLKALWLTNDENYIDLNSGNVAAVYSRHDGIISLTEGTPSKQPLYQNNKANHDGVSEELTSTNVISNIENDTAGTWFFWFDDGVINPNNSYFANFGTSTTNRFNFRINGLGQFVIEYNNSGAGVQTCVFNGPSHGLGRKITVESTGTAYNIWQDRVAQTFNSGTNNGFWHGDMTDLGTEFYVGRLGGGYSVFYDMDWGGIAYINRVLSIKERTDMWNYLDANTNI